MKIADGYQARYGVVKKSQKNYRTGYIYRDVEVQVKVMEASENKDQNLKNEAVLDQELGLELNRHWWVN